MNIVILGAGGQGKVVLDILKKNNYHVIGFIDDDKNKKGKLINNVKVLGNFLDINKTKKNIDGIVIGIGDNNIRSDYFLKIKKLNLKIVNAIHPNTIISENVKIGKGVIIVGGAVVNTNVKIGNNVIINTGATVDHDCVLGDNSQICPGVNLAGNVKIKKNAFIGTGAVINPGICIGENSIVGSGSTIIRDVPKNVVVVGMPGKIIKKIGDR